MLLSLVSLFFCVPPLLLEKCKQNFKLRNSVHFYVHLFKIKYNESNYYNDFEKRYENLF